MLHLNVIVSGVFVFGEFPVVVHGGRFDLEPVVDAVQLPVYVGEHERVLAGDDDFVEPVNLQPGRLCEKLGDERLEVASDAAGERGGFLRLADL